MKNKISATSDNRNVTLSGFTFITDELPDDFEVCLLIENNGHLSAGFWETGMLYTQGSKPGVFRQSCEGVLEVEDT